jgi:bacterioferritin
MSVRDEFKEHADAEREHADRIADRVQQLGGKPDFNPKSLLERSASRYVEGIRNYQRKILSPSAS